MNKHLASIIREADKEQTDTLGDYPADLIVHLSTGQAYRGHVHLDVSEAGGVVLYPRLNFIASRKVSILATATVVIDEENDGGISELPIHVDGNFITHVHYPLLEG